MENNKEETLAPQFTNLSSGEIMILGMMASILKEYDRVNNSNITDLKEISGIVLIDEIDLHLHSDLLKRALPNLIGIFPKIQFVLTSHSPFFLLGMKERFGETCNFVTLPTGTLTNQIERFDEIERCYAIIDDSYKEVLNSLDDVQNKLKTLSKPLIITEGKTDWKHIKHALSVFQAKGEFQNLDVDFQKYEDSLGESKLKTLLENLAKVSHPHKIIGVFDSDTKIGEKYSEVYTFSNNVFACCIKDVQGYNCGISIELLYRRADLKICDNDGRRLYLSDEFTEKSHQLKENSKIVCTNKTLVGAYKEKMIKIIDCEVFNDEEKSLALSKNDFADNVYQGNGNFANINVEGFREILETISSICNK